MSPLQITINLLAAMAVSLSAGFGIGYLEGMESQRQQVRQQEQVRTSNCPPESVDTGSSCAPRFGLDPFKP